MAALAMWDTRICVHLFVGLTRECEDCQKIIRRLMVRKQAQKPKITNDIKIHLEFRHESQSNKLKVYEKLQQIVLSCMSTEY
ncbi:hypothetical protein T01_16250 [Trichinella spiralis]|uniref:Uncharacterized protein n=1 Tax=Trichinella spiralis TaxID=6334 RepID=A0A0V1AIK3_TRISP|nr:hypothetical protein T01_16250 [Trichinella spiralis]